MQSRYVSLATRPQGMPTLENFSILDRELPALEEGQVLVKTLWMSVDPYMRSRMEGISTYIEPFQIGEPLEGGCVGEILESTHPKFKTGDKVVSGMEGGWQSHYISNGKGLMTVDESAAPLPLFLGPLGMTGFTAYVGLQRYGRPKTGETVFVSGAAGAVGSIVCQIAGILGCRVVASAGSEEKIRWLLDDLKVDAAFNYRQAESIGKALARSCPQGVDVYFDNVGGEHLQAALNQANNFARFVMCGMIEQYNLEESPAGPNNLINIVGKRLKISGFVILDETDLQAEFVKQMSQWIAKGKIHYKETILEGLESAPEAFLGLFKGQNIGKMLVKL